MLKNDPRRPAVPMAGAFMLAPLEVLLLTPLPAIGINAHAMFRLGKWCLPLKCQHSPSALHAIPADALVAARASPQAPNKMAFAIGCMLFSFILAAPKRFVGVMVSCTGASALWLVLIATARASQ